MFRLSTENILLQIHTKEVTVGWLLVACEWGRVKVDSNSLDCSLACSEYGFSPKTRWKPCLQVLLVVKGPVFHIFQI